MGGHQPREADELFSVTVNPARAEEGPEPAPGPARPPPAPAIEAGLPRVPDEGGADPEAAGRDTAEPGAIR